MQYFQPSLSYQLLFLKDLCFVYLKWPFYTGFTVLDLSSFCKRLIGPLSLRDNQYLGCATQFNLTKICCQPKNEFYVKSKVSISHMRIPDDDIIYLNICPISSS